MNGLYQTTRGYLNCLCELTGWNVCLFDPHCLWQTLDQFSLHFENELVHSIDYCLQIKSHHRLWRRCIICKWRALDKLKETHQPFYGECCFGVGEYLYPLILNGDVVAYISVYGFHPRQMSGLQQTLISNCLGLHAEDYQTLLQETLSPSPPNHEQMNAMLAVLGQLLMDLIAHHRETHPENLRPDTNHTHLLPAMQAIDYIRELYMNPIQISDIANFCHVSESYLQHVFKKAYGYSPHELLIRIRLEHVCKLLIETDLPVYAIAPRAGFSDPNYLSAVFSKRYGITCLQYRRKYSQQE